MIPSGIRVHTHSTFALGYEAGINKSTVDGNLVPPSGLITFVQKGIQYLELKATASNYDTDMDEDFQFLQPIDLIMKDVYELHKIIKEKKEKLQKERKKNIRESIYKDSNDHEMELEWEPTREREKEKQQKEKRARARKRKRKRKD
ncbi:hypothetical protein FXO38_33077 [Capsicum annuum]|uniref:Uncharacterized protein n=1 Tax=Capsicum annuum TaxID=4072 RepID=A0A2G2YB11_CAPAN|nr:hypothetical protein FXO38_33077 [Capsicum annuum]KAF3619708.1 hypothetical protein FXO37_33584 [Capsicum annuum]PHT66904.1 hypothetical protein T459_31329 [Capsicum annuum]